MDTESAMLNALNIGADDGRKTENGMVTRMNKLVELLEVERPIIPDSNADYDIGYNNGLVMAQAIALKHDAVPVVRCKDCKYKFSANGHNKNGCPLDGAGLMNDDDFCSYGERKGNE